MTPDHFKGLKLQRKHDGGGGQREREREKREAKKKRGETELRKGVTRS